MASELTVVQMLLGIKPKRRPMRCKTLAQGPLHLGGTVLLGLCLVSGCDRGRSSDGGATVPVAASVKWPDHPVALTDSFELSRSFTFSSSGDSAVLAIRSLDIDDSGRLLLVDSRSSNLKIVGADGKIQSIVGKKGAGPGEFRAPFDAKFIRGGGLVAVDPIVSRVSWFDANWQYESSFSPVGQDPRVVLPWSDSLVSVGGLVDVGTNDALFATYDRGGTRIRSFGGVDSIVYELQMVVDNPWAALAGDGKIVGNLSVAPGIYEFDSLGDLVGQSPTSPPPPLWNQLKPRSDGSSPRIPAEMKAWIQSASLALAGGVLGNGMVVVSVRTAGKDFLYQYTSNLEPSAIYELPFPGRLVLVRGSYVYFVNEEAEDISLLIYRKRAH